MSAVRRTLLRSRSAAQQLPAMGASMTELASIDDLVIELPARPAVLAELTAELESFDPDFRKVSKLINNDIGLAAAVVKTANSPLFGVSGRIVSVQQAINYLGLAQVFSLVTGVMLRRAFPDADPLLDTLWQISSTRAAIMGRLARNTLLAPDRAYTVGLFQDCGVALLATRSKDYRRTWERTRWLPAPLEIEQHEHEIDHATVSAALVRHWGLAGEISQAVEHHHNVDMLDAAQISRTQSLIALSMFANFTLAQTRSQDLSAWAGPVGKAGAIFNLLPAVTQSWIEQASALIEGSPR